MIAPRSSVIVRKDSMWLFAFALIALVVGNSLRERCIIDTTPIPKRQKCPWAFMEHSVR